MIFKYVDKNVIVFVKLLSIIFIANAIGLELCNIYAALTDAVMPNIPMPIFWFGRFAMTTHLIEAVIAAFYAPSRNKALFSPFYLKPLLSAQLNHFY
jgi:hypothetical protein